MALAMSAHDESDAPLDPAQERLRRKLVRLLVVSGGIMMLGLVAVFAAIVYKVGERNEAADLSTAAPMEGSIGIPAGYRLAGASLDGERALLTLEGPDGDPLLLVVDLKTGAVLARHRLAGE